MAKNYETPANEYFPTPQETVDRLWEIISIREDWTYLEPCKGKAEAIYKHLPQGSQWAELSEGVDYLTTEFKPVDCIITNPPFSLTVQFLEKSFTEADVVIYLQRLNFLGSVKRKEFWKKNKPTNMIVLSKRPSFSGDGKTDGADYCWYIWDKKGKLGLEEPFYFV